MDLTASATDFQPAVWHWNVQGLPDPLRGTGQVDIATSDPSIRFEYTVADGRLAISTSFGAPLKLHLLARARDERDLWLETEIVLDLPGAERRLVPGTRPGLPTPATARQTSVPGVEAALPASVRHHALAPSDHRPMPTASVGYDAAARAARMGATAGWAAAAGDANGAARRPEDPADAIREVLGWERDR